MLSVPRFTILTGYIVMGVEVEGLFSTFYNFAWVYRYGSGKLLFRHGVSVIIYLDLS